LGEEQDVSSVNQLNFGGEGKPSELRLKSLDSEALCALSGIPAYAAGQGAQGRSLETALSA
jgi:hypothetical protein